jgi:dolichyl-phosphate-mannose--protein O-mannosyl transferase
VPAEEVAGGPQKLEARATAQPVGDTPRLWFLVCFVAVLALNTAQLGRPNRYIFDEVYHAHTAIQLARGNAAAWLPGTVDRATGVANEWTHPPLAKLMMETGILVLGEKAFGWRVASAVFGALGVALVLLAGWSWFGAGVGVLAALFLALDGLWFVQSRVAMNDVFLAVFVLAAFLSWSRWRTTRASGWLLGTGALLGLAISTKWSGLAALGLLFLLSVVTVWRERHSPGVRVSVVARWMVLAFVLIPAVLYLVSYAQFFAMHHSLREWWTLQWQMLRYHSHLQRTHPGSSPWWSWPLLLRPVWYASEAHGHAVQQMFALGNPILWWLFLPGISVLAWRFVAAPVEQWRDGLVAVGFLGNWLPWALSPRIAFLYHMLPSVPFGCLALARALSLLRGRWRVFRWAYGPAVVVSFLYFYPHLAGSPLLAEKSQARYWLPGWDPQKTLKRGEPYPRHRALDFTTLGAWSE